MAVTSSRTAVYVAIAVVFLVLVVTARRFAHHVRSGGRVGSPSLSVSMTVLVVVMAFGVVAVRFWDTLDHGGPVQSSSPAAPVEQGEVSGARADGTEGSAGTIAVLANTDVVRHRVAKAESAVPALPRGACTEGRASNVASRPQAPPSVCPAGFTLVRGGLCAQHGAENSARVVPARCPGGSAPVSGLCPLPCPAGWTAAGLTCVLCNK